MGSTTFRVRNARNIYNAIQCNTMQTGPLLVMLLIRRKLIVLVEAPWNWPSRLHGRAAICAVWGETLGLPPLLFLLKAASTASMSQRKGSAHA